MHLYKQKTSRFWWVQLYGPDGNAVYKSTKQTVKREAKKVAEDLAAEMRREASKATGLAQPFQDLLRRAANAAEEGVLTLSMAGGVGWAWINKPLRNKSISINIGCVIRNMV